MNRSWEFLRELARAVSIRYFSPLRSMKQGGLINVYKKEIQRLETAQG